MSDIRELQGYINLYGNMEDALSSAITGINALRTALNNAMEQRDEARMWARRLYQENAALRQENDCLTAAFLESETITDKGELRGSIVKLQQENEELSRLLNTYQQEGAEFIYENKNLRQELAALHQKIAALRQENEELLRKNNYLQVEFQKLIDVLYTISDRENWDSPEQLYASQILHTEYIKDGVGRYWPAKCPKCGGAMQVIRPGVARCSECEN